MVDGKTQALEGRIEGIQMVHLDGGIPWGTVNAVQSKALIQFCLRRSRQIALPREHREKIDEEILEKLKQEALKEIRQRSERQIRHIKSLSRKQLKADGFLSLNWGIDNITTNAKQEAEEIRQVRCRYKKEDALEADLEEYGLIRRKFALHSFTTYRPGVVWDICYFDKDWVDLSEQRKNLFAYPLWIGGYEFEDPAFVNEDGKPWMWICSHEASFSMKLSDEDYKEFQQMKISHAK